MSKIVDNIAWSNQNYRYVGDVSPSNLLAHEDLGHLRKPIIGIYKKSSIMKIPTSI